MQCYVLADSFVFAVVHTVMFCYIIGHYALKLMTKPIKLHKRWHYRLCTSQWSSANMPDCKIRDPRIESYHGQLYLSLNHCNIQPWARPSDPYCSV